METWAHNDVCWKGRFVIRKQACGVIAVTTRAFHDFVENQDLRLSGRACITIAKSLQQLTSSPFAEFVVHVCLLRPESRHGNDQPDPDLFVFEPGVEGVLVAFADQRCDLVAYGLGRTTG
jgi:hypothetical protein